MKAEINLLPRAFRRRHMARRRLTQWGAITCVVVLIVLFARWQNTHEYHTVSLQLETLTNEYNPTEKMIQELTQMRQQVQRLQAQEEKTRRLEQRRQVLPLLGVISHATRPTGQNLRLTKLDATALQESISGRADNRRPSHAGMAKLVGVSLTSAAVTELLDRLQTANYFGSVELIKLNQRQENEATLHEYEVRCQL